MVAFLASMLGYVSGGLHYVLVAACGGRTLDLHRVPEVTDCALLTVGGRLKLKTGQQICELARSLLS